MSLAAAYTALLDSFSFAPFTRRAVRAAKLEGALAVCEAAGFATFVRCIGAEPNGVNYHCDNEQFRMLAGYPD